MLCIVTFCLFERPEVNAQARFVTQGIIEYEKTVNVYGLIRRAINTIPDDNTVTLRRDFDQYQQVNPQFRVLKSSLLFSENKTLYFPSDSMELKPINWYMNLPMATQQNTVYTDFSAGLFYSQKPVFENTFLVKDTLRKVQWKITDETRTIAGYTCRRANAIVLDSIYAVAFYTDKIAVSGGPELFTGLPGVILGIALPYENVTWFATKVELSTAGKLLSPPTKGKMVSDQEFRNTIHPLLKNQVIFSMLWKAYLL